MEKTMACEACKQFSELLDLQVEKLRRSAKPGEAVPDKPLTVKDLASLWSEAVNGPAPAPPPKRTRTVERVVHSAMMQELLNLRKEHKDKTAGLSEEHAAKVTKSHALINLEWQYDLSKRGLGNSIGRFSSSVVTDEVEIEESSSIEKEKPTWEAKQDGTKEKKPATTK
jgi:hypothetical protein